MGAKSKKTKAKTSSKKLAKSAKRSAKAEKKKGKPPKSKKKPEPPVIRSKGKKESASAAIKAKKKQAQKAAEQRERQQQQKKERPNEKKKAGVVSAAPPVPTTTVPTSPTDAQQRAANKMIEKALHKGLEALALHNTLFSHEGQQIPPVCRESQIDAVTRFLTADSSVRGRTDGDTGGVSSTTNGGGAVPFACSTTLQLFGMPGTGKTAVVKHVLRELSASPSSRISYLFLNGYIMQKPTEVFTLLYKKLTKDRLGKEQICPPDQAANLLEKRFRTLGWSSSITGGGGHPQQQQQQRKKGGKGGGKHGILVIVVDEIDKCCDRSGKTLFRLVDWMSLPHAHCRLITIANSMQLPERIDPKTRSRLNTTDRITFEPYTAEQLERILHMRIDSISPPLLAPIAISYVCKQIAGHNGDVRRLLQLTAAAVHETLCAEDGLPLMKDAKTGIVQMKQLHAVIRSALLDRSSEYIGSMKDPWLLLLIAVIAKMSHLRETVPGSDPSIPLAGLRQEFVRELSMHEYPLRMLEKESSNNSRNGASAGDGEQRNTAGSGTGGVGVGRKAHAAARQQEQGIFVIHTDGEKSFPWSQWYIALDFLRQAHLIDIVTGESGSEIPLITTEATRSFRGSGVPGSFFELASSEPAAVIMLQPSQTVQTLCEIHDLYGSVLARVFKR